VYVGEGVYVCKYKAKVFQKPKRAIQFYVYFMVQNVLFCIILLSYSPLVYLTKVSIQMLLNSPDI